MNDNHFGNTILSEKLYSLLLRCSHALSRGHYNDKSINPSQGRILSILWQNGEMAQKDLLEVLQIRAASLSELLTKLEKKELVTRKKEGENKRNVIIELTNIGKATMKKNADLQENMAQEAFSILSIKEQESMIEILEKLVNTWHNEHHNHHKCHDKNHDHHRR